MHVISNELGVCLVFNSVDDLHHVIEHLKGMEEHIVGSEVAPPHLYMSFHESIPEDVVSSYLKTLKLSNIPPTSDQQTWVSRR